MLTWQVGPVLRRKQAKYRQLLAWLEEEAAAPGFQLTARQLARVLQPAASSLNPSLNPYPLTSVPEASGPQAGGGGGGGRRPRVAALQWHACSAGWPTARQLAWVGAAARCPTALMRFFSTCSQESLTLDQLALSINP